MATDINHVILVGRLTRDLKAADQREFAYTANGQARANISIAVNRSRRQGEQWVDEVSYFDLTIWGKTAENLKQYLTKGKQIAVEGHLKQDRWEKDGQRFSKVSIVADNIQLLGGRGEQSGGSYAGNQTGAYQQPQQGYAQTQAQGFAPNADEFPEDIPF